MISIGGFSVEVVDDLFSVEVVDDLDASSRSLRQTR